MDAQSFWFSSGATGGGGGGDQGDPIGESLRFRQLTTTTGSTLSRTGFATGGNVWTFSCWMKGWSGSAQTQCPIFSWHVNAADAVDELAILSNFPSDTENIIYFYFEGSNNGNFESNQQFNDPAAWYHVVWQSSSLSDVRLFINGNQVTDWSTSNPVTSQNYINQNSTCSIGSRAPANTSPSSISYYGDGYLADVYFIDGQSLQPTAFGRFNDNGIWVPVDYNGDADDYGANGFHLTFEDPDDLGADTAPIGATGHTAANDFTATGFDTDPVGIFSDNCAGYQGAYNATSTAQDYEEDGPTALFDGNTGTLCQTPGQGFINANFNPPLTGVTQLRIFIGFWSQIRVNDTNILNFTGGSALQWRDISALIPANGQITQIAYGDTAGSTTSSRASAIEVNGTILVDNTGTDYDSMQDSPTQNWATQNPLLALPEATWSAPAPTNANLLVTGQTTTTGQDEYFNSSVGIPQGTNVTYYAEFQVQDLGGTTNPNYPVIAIKYNKWNGTNDDNKFYLNCDGTAVSEGTALTNGPAFANVNDVVGITWNASTGTVTVAVNGGAATTWNLGAADATSYITTANLDNTGVSGNSASSCNYGQQPFVHRPANLTDDNNLQTQNLPTPTILDGSDNFRALTGTGANILAIAQGTNNTGDNWNPDVNTGFANGLWWIKDMDNVNNHQLLDSVRGGNLVVSSNLSTGETTYVAPTGDSVAWCWLGGGAAVTNTNGDIESQVSANTDAGFSIVTYTGQTGDNSIGHGLNQEPECVFTKMRNDPSQNTWVCYFKDLGRNVWLNLNNSNAIPSTPITDYWGPATSWTTTTMGVRNTGDANNNMDGIDTVSYCWHSVPGYSAFGSYQGNGVADGPFIYLGFRPAFVMFKRANNTGPWAIYDSTRSPNNPADELIYANTTAAEFPGGNGFALDLLSNGFKWRSTTTDGNATGGEYVYAAFAENPFGGEDTAPANAR